MRILSEQESLELISNAILSIPEWKMTDEKSDLVAAKNNYALFWDGNKKILLISSNKAFARNMAELIHKKTGLRIGLVTIPTVKTEFGDDVETKERLWSVGEILPRAMTQGRNFVYWPMADNDIF